MSDPDSISTVCPNCSKSFDVDASSVGRKGLCDACGEKFIIEAIASSKPMAENRPDKVVKPSPVPTAAGQGNSSSKSLVAAAGFLVVVCAGFWIYANRELPEPVAPIESDTVNENEKLEGTQSSKTADRAESGEEVPTVITPPSAGPDSGHTNPEVTKSPLQPMDSTFPVVTKFEQIDIRDYRNTYADVHMGWMPNGADQAEEAKRWGSHLGPLGLRIRSHVPQLQGRPAFAANVPLSLRSQSGELALNAAEVIGIAPGSPADGHLRIGDLIIGIEGEMLKSGNAYRPDWDFMHKDARELQLMLGEKIDQAQGRGDVRLSVLRIPSGSEQALPVSTRELWAGAGGNNSVGVQEFDVELPEGGYLTLESNQFDGSIHGDGSMWMDVVLVGDYGEKSLFELPSLSLQAGYGRAVIELEKPTEHQGKQYQQILNLHAQGTGKWELPEGTQRVKGKFAALSYGKVQPRVLLTNRALPLEGIHRDSVVEIRFPIGKVGSFSATYPRDCEKSEITVTRHTDWLAAQQREDGSWPRLAGYTRDGWDTAWCALALMSSGDAKYDEQVRKSAYRVAYHDAPGEWTAERAMRLIFLSEYYLKTKDTDIVSGIQAAYEQLSDCVKNDYMAGHKVNGFGYGISGQHYGTGHLALGMALASRTPISFNRQFVDSIIRHAGEVCVNGSYAYGRGRRLARSDERRIGGGNAMSGPGLLGVQIGGGHQSAVQEMVERMEASLGDGDNSHATSSLAFIFSSLALAAADEEVFLKHMQNFRYKMTIDDNWEGGILKSAFPLDFQGGEGVTANWIRSAGTILVMNALKHELAITGKKELWADDKIETVAVSEWGGQIHSYYLRNWCLAQELLGNRAPKALRGAIRQLYFLPRDAQLVPATRELVEKAAPVLIRQIAANTSLTKNQRAYAAELISGVDFKIYTKKEGEKQGVELQVHLPFQQLNWLDEDKEAMFSSSDLGFKSKVEIQGEALKAPVVYQTEDLKGFNLDQGVRKFNSRLDLNAAGAESFKGVAEISFKLGSSTFSYKRPLAFNTEFSHSNHYNLRRLQLRLRMAPRAYFQSQALIIAGLPFDCMYPVERMLEIEGPKDGIDVISHEGDRVLVDISSENFICPWVHAIKFEKESQVKILRARKHEMIVGKMEGEVARLYDFSNETACSFTGENSAALIEFDFGQMVRANGLDAHFQGARFMRIWYRKGETWVPLVWDNYSVGSGQIPVFPETSARFWRVEMQFGGKLDVQTLRFHHNPNTIFERKALPQSVNPEYLPPIKTASAQ